VQVSLINPVPLLFECGPKLVEIARFHCAGSDLLIQVVPNVFNDVKVRA
jgi:hypothetical protein